MPGTIWRRSCSSRWRRPCAGRRAASRSPTLPKDARTICARFVRLRHGPPSHDTFSRVLRLLDPDELARAFAAFMTALRQGLGLPPPQGVVAVDAKALRRGYERGRAHLPPLMVSVWDAETRLAIAAARAPGGSEVKATLALLKGLSLKGCTVTADALHCHPAMARPCSP